MGDNQNGAGSKKRLLIILAVIAGIAVGVYNHWFSSDAYVREGDELTLKGESLKACEAYDKAIERNPQNVNAYLGRARSKGDIEDYNKVLELSPNNVEAYIGRADGYCSSSLFIFTKQKLSGPKYKEAIEDCNKAIELNPKAWIAYCVRAQAYSYLKDYANAKADCARALEIEPQSARAYETLAWSCKGQDSIVYFSKALDCALSKNYQDKLLVKEFAGHNASFGKKRQNEMLLSNLYSGRGWCYARLGKRDDAVADAKRAGETDYLSCGTLQEYGKLCFDEGKYLDAIFYYTEDIKYAKEREQKQSSTPLLDKVFATGEQKSSIYKIEDSYKGLAQAYYKQGHIYYKERNFVGAIEKYTKAIELNYPHNHAAYHDRGCCYAEQGEFAQAISDYTKAIELNPKEATYYNNRGIVHRQLGNSAQAEADFAKARELEAK